MRVGRADIKVRDLVNQIKARNMPKSKRVRTPNCTHVDMDRVYGRDQQCFVCGREPSIGFLYECRQDCDTRSLHDLLEQENEDSREILKSDMRLQLEWVGLSESVIHAAEQGHYTKAQLEKLKGQKQELRLTISDALQASQINNAVSKLAAMEYMPPNNDGAGLSIGRDGVSPWHLGGDWTHWANIASGPSELCVEGVPLVPSLLPRPRLHILPGSLRRRLRSRHALRHRVATYQVGADHEVHWQHRVTICYSFG